MKSELLGILVVVGFILGFGVMYLIHQKKPIIKETTIVKEINTTEVVDFSETIEPLTHRFVMDTVPCNEADIIYYKRTEGTVTTLGCGRLPEVNH